MNDLYPIYHSDLQSLLDAMDKVDETGNESLFRAAYDELCAELGHTHAGRVLSEACCQYDRLHGVEFEGDDE